MIHSLVNTAKPHVRNPIVCLPHVRHNDGTRLYPMPNNWQKGFLISDIHRDNKTFGGVFFFTFTKNLLSLYFLPLVVFSFAYFGLIYLYLYSWTTNLWPIGV